MLDENLKHLLSYVNKNVGNNFAIITADEILPCFSSDKGVLKEDLFNMFNLLSTKGFIRLKYNDGNSFCCMISEKGADYLEENKNPIIIPIEKPNYSIVGWCVFASFLGAFIGGGVSIVLSFLL